MKTTNTVSKNIALTLAIAAAVLVAVLICLAGGGNAVFASDVTTEGAAAAQAAPSLTAVGAAVAIGLAALGGAIAMGMAIAKAMEGIARQPEADDADQHIKEKRTRRLPVLSLLLTFEHKPVR